MKIADLARVVAPLESPRWQPCRPPMIVAATLAPASAQPPHGNATKRGRSVVTAEVVKPSKRLVAVATAGPQLLHRLRRGARAAAWNPTNACPRLLCPFHNVQWSCRSADFRGHFAEPCCEEGVCLDSCLDSCLDKTTSSNFKFSSSVKFCCLDVPPPSPLNGK